MRGASAGWGMIDWNSTEIAKPIARTENTSFAEKGNIMTTTRRHFLQATAALAASNVIAANAHAQGGDQLKVGLIGCGSRGTGAAAQALQADRNVKLWAMADAFEDRIATSLATLGRDADIANKIDVPAARKHV